MKMCHSGRSEGQILNPGIPGYGGDAMLSVHHTCTSYIVALAVSKLPEHCDGASLDEMDET
jgi:hypothetical protein